MDSISEIKNRLPIEQLVSQYVQLKKVGRHYKALCPFHKERTPSFYVSPEKQLAYCFGCHKGGDHFKFIEEIEGLDFPGALKMLAEKAGVDLPKMPPQDKKKKSERDRLMILHEQAANFYQRELENTSEGKKVLKYLVKRGLEEKTIRLALLGLAPQSGNALYNHLLTNDFTRDEIIASGLVIGRDIEKNMFIDRFRLRLIFPIRNIAGNICAFGGRALKDGDEPKYLNSPETPIFHKSSFLYGLSEARGRIREKNEVVVVEGYMDALSVRQAGFANVVACGGTALTEEQLVILKRFSSNIIFSFDRDNAGKMATRRAIELGFKHELSPKVAVWLSDAKDPDECIKEKPAVFEAALKTAQPALKYLISDFTVGMDIKIIEGKKKLIDELLPFLILIKSPVELDAWLKDISVLADISVSSLYDEMARFKNRHRIFGAISPKSINTTISNAPKKFHIHEYIIGMLLTYPEIYNIANPFLQADDFEDSELQNIYRTVTTKYNQSLGASDFGIEQLREYIRNNLSEEEFSRANILSMFAESKVSEMNWEALETEAKAAIGAFVRQKFDKRKRDIVRKLKETGGSEKTYLLGSYQSIIAEEEELLKRL